jgi:hypothetical protein
MSSKLMASTFRLIKMFTITTKLLAKVESVKSSSLLFLKQRSFKVNRDRHKLKIQRVFVKRFIAIKFKRELK